MTIVMRMIKTIVYAADEQRHPVDRAPMLKLHRRDADDAQADDEQDRDENEGGPVNDIGGTAEQAPASRASRPCGHATH